MEQELFEIYERNFPFLVREKDTVQRILSNKDNIVIEQRDEQNKLIGASVLNQNTILLLCVDVEYRKKGIGSRLLQLSEKAVRDGGYSEIKAGAGFDYIMPGVPTAKRYVEAENESLYQNIDETASEFFTKRGYVHSWKCNCFDMRVSLSRYEKEEYHVGDTIGNITYRFAVPDDREGICACTDDAYPEFTKYYQGETLYDSNSSTRVLAAFADGKAVGAVIVGIEDAGKQLGSVGCTAVRPAFRGRHIAVNLVIIATKYLKDAGMREAYLGYTYTGLDHLYGYAGYRVCIYYMMAVKGL